MSNLEWEELSREIVFEKYGRKVEKVVFRLPHGKEGDYYIKDDGTACMILALTKDQKVVLAKQYRPGPKAILYEVPGGFLDAGEDPLKTAKRELLEETGYTGDFEEVGFVYDDAYSTMKRRCIVATNCVKVAEPQLGDSEFIDVELLSLEDFRQLLRSGRMSDVEIGYLGLDYLGLL